MWFSLLQAQTSHDVSDTKNVCRDFKPKFASKVLNITFNINLPSTK